MGEAGEEEGLVRRETEANGRSEERGELRDGGESSRSVDDEFRQHWIWHRPPMSVMELLATTKGLTEEDGDF